MKLKKLLLNLLAVVCIGLTGLGLASCEVPDIGDIPSSDSSGGVETESKLSFKNLVVEGNTVSGVFANAVTEFSFADEIEISAKKEYAVAKDQYGSQIYLTKTVPLEEGDNIFYVFEMVGSNIEKTYTVTLRRRPMYQVCFDTVGGTVVQEQRIEEGQLATSVNNPKKTGYTFTGWDYDFSQAIIQDTKITATYTANMDTPYKVEHYLQNLEGYYTLYETDNLVGTTDTMATAIIKEYDHFSQTYESINSGNLNGDGSSVSSVHRGNINGDGSCVLKVYYRRKDYSVFGGDDTAGEIEFANEGRYYDGKTYYKYGTQITATVKPYLAYDFVGWYKGEECLSQELSYTCQIDGDIVAKFSLKAGMENFEFGTSETGCGIGGLKDNTLTKITIPDCVTSIGDEAFRGCTSLTEVVIGDSVTYIGYAAFYDCSSLKGVILPNSVEDIGYEAFANCSNLMEVVIPDDVRLMAGCFEGCNIKKLDLGVCWEYFYWAVGSFTGLEHLILRKDKIIGINIGFPSSLISLAFPECTTSISSVWLSGGKNLKEIIVAEGNTAYQSINGDLYTKDGKKLIKYAGGKEEKVFVVPDSVVEIDGYAFWGAGNLTTLIVHNNVVRWLCPDYDHEYAFTGCDLLSIYCELESKPIASWSSALFNERRNAVYWYRETRPTETGNYWHYNENGGIEVWE